MLFLEIRKKKAELQLEDFWDGGGDKNRIKKAKLTGCFPSRANSSTDKGKGWKKVLLVIDWVGPELLNNQNTVTNHMRQDKHCYN